MNYKAWEAEVSPEIKSGPVYKFYAYPKALFLYDLVWADCDYWQKDRRDYARFLKIAVGSARETQGWYWRGRKLLPPEVYQHRIALLDEIIALLVTEIGCQIRKARR